MFTSEFYSFQPRLRSHTIAPSQDYSTELLLVLVESGAALGITYAEKRLVDLMNGRYTLREILARMDRQTHSPLSTLRRLLWDLDRYGFLHESPWRIHRDLPIWGYWGERAHYGIPLHYFPLLGQFELILGKRLLSPRYTLLTMLLGILILLWVNPLVMQDELFVINGSIAKACLATIFAAIGFCLLGNWLSAMALQAVHPGRVEVLVDFTYGIPILRLDGRRLRALRLRDAACVALSPASILFLLASIFFLMAKASGEAMQGWLLHLGLAAWAAFFLQTTPWHSTILTRDLILRLRGETISPTIRESLIRLIQCIRSTSYEIRSYKNVFLVWGVWSLLYMILFVQLLRLLFQWDYMELLRSFIREESLPILLLFFLFLAVCGAAVMAVLITYAFLFLKWIYNEVHCRYWPQNDRVLVGITAAAVLFIFAQLYWIQYPSWNFYPGLYTLILGALVLGTSSYQFIKEGRSGEAWIFLPVTLCGISLLLRGFSEQYIQKQPPLEDLYPTEITSAVQNDTLLLLVSMILLQGSLLFYLGYLFYLFTKLFRPRWPNTPSFAVFTPLLILSLWAAYTITQALPLVNSSFGETGRILLVLVVFIQTFILLLYGPIRNASTDLMGMSLLLFLIGMLWDAPVNRWISQEHWIVAGIAALFSSYILRRSALDKLRLGLLQQTSPISTLRDWRHGQLCVMFQTVIEELFQARPRVAVPAQTLPENTQKYFQRIQEICGIEVLEAASHRVTAHVPWNAAQFYASLLPKEISLLPLMGWTSDRIERKLRRVPALSQIDPNEMHRIARVIRFALNRPGDMLIHQGQKGQDLFVLLEGQISVEIDSPFGHKIMAIFGPDRFVGEIGFLATGERTASIRVLTPSLALQLSRNDIGTDMPQLQAVLMDSRMGENDQKALSRAELLSEFPPALILRIYLESQCTSFSPNETLILEKSEYTNRIAVMLSGQGILSVENKHQSIIEGQMVGFDACMNRLPPRGRIHFQKESRLLWMDAEILWEAMTEMLTPQEVFHIVMNQNQEAALQKKEGKDAVEFLLDHRE